MPTSVESASPMEDALLAEMAALPPLEDALEVFGVARATEPDPLDVFNDPNLEALCEEAMVVAPRNKRQYEQRSRCFNREGSDMQKAHCCTAQRGTRAC